MKKILFSMLAVAAIASCAKTEPTYVEVDSEIKLNPVTTVATKANQLTAITGTQYPVAEAFDVYAYWINEAGVKSADYLTDETSGVEFVNKGAYWGGTTTYYWPKNGSLRFAAYSPSSLDMLHDYAADTYRLDNHVYPAADVTVDAANYTAKTYDILVAKTSEPYTAETGASKVSVKFEHALAWVTFKLQSTEVADGAFTVEKVVVNDAAKKGTLVANMAKETKTWSDLDNKSAIDVFGGSYTVTPTATVKENVANGLLVLPQTPTTVTVYYTQNELSHTDAAGNKVVDSPALPGQVITVPLVLDNADDIWEPGKHYTYTVLFDLDEILINPTVEDWEETTEVIINSDPVKVNTSAELVAAVAEGKDVVLEQSITLEEPVIVEPVVETKAATVFEVTIDLNGKDIIAPLFTESNGTVVPGDTDSYAFWVKEGAKLTINGNGNVTTQACKYSIAVWADGGEVVINGGTYANDEKGEGSDLIYAKNGGKVSIYGGEFIANTKKEGTDGTNEKRSALNLHGNTTGNEIVVYGGRFFEFDPSNNASENPAENFCADGYAAFAIGEGWYEVAAKTAPVEVATAAALQSVVGQGGSAVLAKDIKMDAALVMSGNAVLDGNGYTLTSTPTGSAARAINVSGGENVVIKNLTVVAPGERAINIIQNTKNVQIENVTATAANYTVNVAGSASEANVSIADSDLTGLCTINVGAVDVVVTVTNTKITCADNNAAEHYGAITCNTNAVNSKVTVNGGEVVVNGDSYAANQAAAGSVIAFIGTKGSTSVKDAYFAIKYGNYAYTFVDFESALDKAVDGETITLLKDVTTDSHLNINKSVNFDMNGHTLTVDVKDGSGDDAIWVRDNAEVTITGNGTINFDNLSESTVYASGIFATGTSKVTIESVNVVAGAEAVFAQSNAKVVINGGTYKSIEHPEFTLNLKDSARATASILVNGGSFYQFNPADNAAEGEHTNFVAVGKTVEQNGDWYVVK